MATLLSDSDINTRLEALDDGWTLGDKSLERSFRFPDFVTAFGFMSEAALVAERLNHHPEWFNVYATVRVKLSTHDAGGVTALDFQLAAAMDASARRRL